MSLDFIYGTAWKEDQTSALVEMALRQGFRAIDTANQRRHYVEAGVGEALARTYRAGILTRNEVFLQTKFTYRLGQDHRLPYDPSADRSTQVAQSMRSSLEHLGTDYVDSYLLHGPATGQGWSTADAEVWNAMVNEREAGRARSLGVSNVSLRHLEQIVEYHGEAPAFVQNRCFARMGWDRKVREFCRKHRMVYQGFSLLTANPEVLQHPVVLNMARQHGASVAQIVFRFAQLAGMLPLTGTTDATHMMQDLESRTIELSVADVQEIDTLIG